MKSLGLVLMVVATFVCAKSFAESEQDHLISLQTSTGEAVQVDVVCLVCWIILRLICSSIFGINNLLDVCAAVEAEDIEELTPEEVP